MPWSDTDEQILKSRERLSPEERRQAVLRLVASAEALDRIVDKLQPGIIEIAEGRGLDWQLSDEERERLVDDILHE